MPKRSVPVHSLAVHFYGDEIDRVKRTAARFGLDPGPYIRRLAIGTRFRDLPSQQIVVTLYETRDALLEAMRLLKRRNDCDPSESIGYDQLAAEVVSTLKTIDELALDLGKRRQRIIAKSRLRAKKQAPARRPAGTSGIDRHRSKKQPEHPKK